MSTDIATREESQALSLLVNGRRMIEQARSLQGKKEIRDQAQAVAAFLKQRNEAIPTINAAIEIKIVAERSMGEQLRTTQLNGGASELHDETTISPRLCDLGIEKTQSHRWQSLASIPEETFESKLQEVKDRDEPLTTAAFLRLAKEIRPVEPVVPRELDLYDAIGKLKEVVLKVYESWPKDHVEAMGHQLQDLGREILETGEIA